MNDGGGTGILSIVGSIEFNEKYNFLQSEYPFPVVLTTGFRELNQQRALAPFSKYYPGAVTKCICPDPVPFTAPFISKMHYPLAEANGNG